MRFSIELNHHLPSNENKQKHSVFSFKLGNELFDRSTYASQNWVKMKFRLTDNKVLINST